MESNECLIVPTNMHGDIIIIKENEESKSYNFEVSSNGDVSSFCPNMVEAE
jgi:hypothetical protein